MSKAARAANLVNQGTYQVSDFPAGGADDTVQIQNALTWLAGGANRALSMAALATYTVSTPLLLSGASNFRIIGNGATIKAANSMSSAGEAQLFSFTTCTDGVILDLLLDGNRSGRAVNDPNVNDSAAFNVWTGNARLTFFRCQVANSTGDSWYLCSATPTVLASLPTDIQLINCTGTNASRNSISTIDSVRFRDYFGVYTGSNGYAPEAGIDFESNNQTDKGNIDARCYGTRCDGNNGFGFASLLLNSDVKLFGCSVITPSLAGAIGGIWGNLLVDDFVVENYGSVGRGIIDISEGNNGTVSLNRIRSRKNDTGPDTQPVIYVAAGLTGQITIKDVQHYGGWTVLVNANSQCTIDGLTSNGTNADYVFVIGAGANGTIVDNVKAIGTVQVGYINAPDVSVRNVRAVNPSGTTALLLFDTGATRPSLSGFEIIQQTSIPGGQVGAQFATVPTLVTGVIGKSAGTAWTAAGLTVYTAGTVGSLIHGNSPALVNAYTVATLPTTGPLAYNGSTLWASNARNTAEGAGSGTGSIVVYKSGTGWRIPGVVTAVTA